MTGPILRSTHTVKSTETRSHFKMARDFGDDPAKLPGSRMDEDEDEWG